MNLYIAMFGLLLLALGVYIDLYKNDSVKLLGVYIGISPLLWFYYRVYNFFKAEGGRGLMDFLSKDFGWNWLFFGYFEWFAVIGGLIAISPAVFRVAKNILAVRRRGPTELS